MASQREISARDYVLGRVDDSGRERAEEQFIGDQHYFAEVMAEEEALIEQYAAGRMAAPDRTDFERQCREREDLRYRVALERQLPAMLRALPSPVARRAADRPAGARALAFPIAAAVAVAMMGIVGLLSFRLQKQSWSLTVREQHWQKRDAEQKNRIAQLEKGQAAVAPPIFAVLISPSTRANAATSYSIPPTSDQVELHFNIGTDTDFPLYRVIVRMNGNVEAAATEKEQVIEGRRVVSAVVPAEFAGRRVFDAQVTGVTASGSTGPLIETYSFALVR
jgi:hypothetical protein